MKKQFAAGDKVSFVRSTARSRSINLKAIEGSIQSIHGDVATVKMRNGRCTEVHVDNLTPAGEPNALTKAFQAAART